MKRWLVTTVLLGLIGGVALPAIAESRSRKRAAANSREAAAQNQAVMAAIMRRFDANKNGRLDPDELKALTAAADTNLDGRVSPEELIAVARGEGKEKERAKDGAGKKNKKKEE